MIGTNMPNLLNRVWLKRSALFTSPLPPNGVYARLAFVACLLLLCLSATNLLGQMEKLTPGQIKEKVGLQRPYRIDDDVAVTLPIGTAVQFDCAENPHFVKEYLVYPDTNGNFWVCYLDSEGELMDVLCTSLRRVQGSMQQVADTPCLAIMKWDIPDQALRLRFCLSTNKERNQREFDQAAKDKVKTALGRRDLRTFPPRTLPETERMAGFVRLWSEVKYNFVFVERLAELDWDKVLMEYLPRVQQAETAHDYLCVLARCLALLHDGHTDVQRAGGGRPHPDRGTYNLPFEVRLLDGNRAVVARVMAASETDNPRRKAELVRADLKPGEELLRIDEWAVGEILQQEIYPYICASTPQDRNSKASNWLLLGRYGSQATLRIKGLDATERVITLTRKAGFPKRRAANVFEFRVLEKGIAYVNLPSFESEEIVKAFEQVFSQVKKNQALILDVRRNGGGNSGFGSQIISRLSDKPIRGLRWKTRQYLPAFRAWGQTDQWHVEEESVIAPGQDSFLGPIVVLTGPETFSAAEDFVAELHASKRATIIGERTAGSTGQPLRFDLPGGAIARVCTKHDTYPDGREFVGIGIVPDVEIGPSAQDIAAQRDVVLERGIEVLRGKINRR
jgi:C-terminal processing protease CtpA/Prc